MTSPDVSPRPLSSTRPFTTTLILALPLAPQAPASNFNAFKEIATLHSHLVRFGHAVATDELLAELKVGESAVLVYPAARYRGPADKERVRYPSKRLYQTPLQTFIFLESSPVVGLFDWRSAERALAADVPILTVFGMVTEPGGEYLHHHGQHGEETEEGEGGKPSGDDPWSFDELAAAIRPVAEAHRHGIHVLLGDKRYHTYEMETYGLGTMEKEDHSIGLAIRGGESGADHYAKVASKPFSNQGKMSEVGVGGMGGGAGGKGHDLITRHINTGGGEGGR